MLLFVFLKPNAERPKQKAEFVLICNNKNGRDIPAVKNFKTKLDLN